jgi:CBS domain-containing protein
MKVSDAMTPDVRLVTPETTICEAAKIMGEIDAGALPVADKDRLVGMITDRDIAVRAVAQSMRPETAVRDIMSNEVLYCFEDQDLEDVADNMSEEKVRRMPVVNRDKRLVGMLSLADIALAEEADTTGRAVADISEPGGEHSQTRH